MRPAGACALLAPEPGLCLPVGQAGVQTAYSSRAEKMKQIRDQRQPDGINAQVQGSQTEHSSANAKEGP